MNRKVGQASRLPRLRRGHSQLRRRRRAGETPIVFGLVGALWRLGCVSGGMFKFGAASFFGAPLCRAVKAKLRPGWQRASISPACLVQDFLRRAIRARSRCTPAHSSSKVATPSK